MIQAKGSSRHPLGQLAYRIISGNTWYDSQAVLMDQKVGYVPCVSSHISDIKRIGGHCMDWLSWAAD